MASKKWVQVEVKELAGSETWVMVRHNGRSFKLPTDAPISQLLQGVHDGWTLMPARTRRSPRSLEEYRRWKVIGEGPTARSVRE